MLQSVGNHQRALREAWSILRQNVDTLENEHGTQEWRFGRWHSLSIGWFLGSIFIFQGCKILIASQGPIHFQCDGTFWKTWRQWWQSTWHIVPRRYVNTGLNMNQYMCVIYFYPGVYKDLVQHPIETTSWKTSCCSFPSTLPLKPATVRCLTHLPWSSKKQVFEMPKFLPFHHGWSTGPTPSLTYPPPWK